jgi:hypothetical protein
MKSDTPNNDDLDQIKQANAGEGLTTNIGFQSPNSPLDLAGLDPLPASGGIGAQDPAAGEDIVGEDQAHDREIARGETEQSGQPQQATPNILRRPDRNANDQTSGGGSTSW